MAKKNWPPRDKNWVDRPRRTKHLMATPDEEASPPSGAPPQFWRPGTVAHRAAVWPALR